MKRREKIDLILIFKKSIGLLLANKISYICGTLDIQKFTDGGDRIMIDKAKEYLFSEIPTSSYNATFYNHRLYNKNNNYFIDKESHNSKSWPWWCTDISMVNMTDEEYNKVFLEMREQRILFLRILIDKLNR